MAYGSPVIVSNSQLVGGPKLLSCTVTIANLDTTGSIDLTSYITNVLHVVSLNPFNTTANLAVSAIDFTSSAGVVTPTHADPTEAGVIYLTIVGI